MRRTLSLGWLVLSISAAACGGGNGSGVPKCVPGDAKACVGANACAGSQTCKSDGTYGACTCGGVGGAGGSTGMGGGSGTTGAAGRGGTTGAAGTGGATGTAGIGGTTGAAGTGGATGTAGIGGTTGAAGNGGMSGAGGAGGGSTLCNPLTQAPCTASQRCAWIWTDVSAGHSACLADGTVAAGGACTVGANGETTGFDNCRRGLACVGGTCQKICDHSVTGSCATNTTCALYSGAPFNLNALDTGVGYCVSTCNPLTQKRDSDGAAACGSPNPASPTLGCYGSPGSDFTCAGAGNASNTSDVPATGPAGGGAYINGCAPGFLPLMTASSGSSTVICVAVCEPGPTSMQSPANAAGKVGSAATCPAKGASGTHECRYFSFVEDPAAPGFPTPLGNTVGFCFNYVNYMYDSDNNGSLDTRTPSCTTLSSTAHTFDTVLTDDVFWGCAPYPAN